MSDDVRFELLDEPWEHELHAINRACPIHADFTFFFDRSPDFFRWPALHFEEWKYAGIFVDRRLVGYGMFGVRTGTLGGRRRRYFYLGDWRLLSEHRGGNLGRRAAEWLLDQLPADITLGVGLVKRGNRPVEHMMRSPDDITWNVSSAGGFCALNIIPLWSPRRGSSCRVERARAEDIDEMVELTVAACRGRALAPERDAIDTWLTGLPQPGLTLEDHFIVRRAGRMVGWVAAWDRTSYHRATVLGYSRRASVLRALLGSVRPLLSTRLPPLPGPGEPLSALTLTCVTIPERDPAILRALLGAVLTEKARGHFHMVQLGLPEADPLLAATRGLLYQRFDSELHLFTREPPPPTPDPWVDLAMI